MSNSLGMTFFGPSGWTKPRYYHTSPFDKDSSDKVLQELPILFSGLSFAKALGREEDLHGEYHARWVSPTLWNHLSHDISLVDYPARDKKQTSTNSLETPGENQR
ncbi:hypothetical protein N7501_012104 [Penicillium viridicatum]|nr:hypothetical protein N7501_012104 [Penicillium viridicatum]